MMELSRLKAMLIMMTWQVQQRGKPASILASYAQQKQPMLL
jgi:hypothetical protein